MLYQRKLLATGELLGEPAPLPPELVGWSDECLADISANLNADACEQLGLVGYGFFPVPEPEPKPPAGPVRIGKYWLFERFTEEQERRYAVLERQVSTADLSAPENEALFQLSRFIRRLNALTIIELDAPATRAGFELLRVLGVFGDPESPESTADMLAILDTSPSPEESA